MITHTVDKYRISVILLTILTIVAVGVVLSYAQSVILPLIVAWLLSFILSPAVNFMANRKIPRPIAIFLVLVFLFGVGYVGVIFFSGRVLDIAAAFPRYNERFNEMILALENLLDLPYNPISKVNWGRTITGFLVKVSGSVFSVLSKLIMVIIFLVFLFLGQPYFKFKIRKAMSSEHAHQVTDIITSISSQIRRYLSVQFLISFATGLLVWLALALIGVDFAITWGALAFFLNFIPTVGSIIASAPPILLALVQFYPNIWPGVITLVTVLTIQMVIGNGIAPKVMGDNLNLSPVVVLLSLLFWGWLWGIVGAVLSIPIAAAIKIVCENIEELRPVSIMMGSGKIFQREFAE